jgi:hypothetical protein
VYVVAFEPSDEVPGSADPTSRPTGVATATPDATPTAPAASPSVSPDPDATPSTPPSASPSDAPASPTATPDATDPGATPSPSSEPTAEPTETPTEEPTPAPTVDVTPAPNGTIEIASDVVVVGGVAAYNRDGSRFAFTARPADGSTGPDVYVWDTAETLARAVTDDHRSILAGWDGTDLLVSRAVDDTPVTVAISARTGAERDGSGRAAWLPSVAPDGLRAVWWDGTVRLAADGVTWVPDRGRLVIGSWPGSADDAQVVGRGDITDWEVRWDPAGTAVALWTAAGGSDEAGRLSLYALDPDTGRARLASPLLRDERAFAGFSLETGRLAYAAPTDGGKRAVWILAWDGENLGKVKLPGEAGQTVVR